MFGKKGIEIKKVKCPVCGKMFEVSERQIFVPRKGSPGLVCRDCNHLREELEEYEARFPKEKNPEKKKKLAEVIAKLEKKLNKVIY